MAPSKLFTAREIENLIPELQGDFSQDAGAAEFWQKWLEDRVTAGNPPSETVLAMVSVLANLCSILPDAPAS